MLASFTTGVCIRTIEKFDVREREMLWGCEIGCLSFAVLHCKWLVKLAIRGPFKSYLYIGLSMAEQSFDFPRTEQVMFDFCVLDARDKKHYNLKDRSKVFSIKSGDNTVWKPFLPATEVASLVSNNELKVRCKIHILNLVNPGEALLDSQLPSESCRPLLPPKLGSDLKAVLENGSLSDVSLVVGDRTIPAHRLSLIHI